MLNEQEFLFYLEDLLSAKLQPEGFSLERITVTRINQKKEGLMLTQKGVPVSPVLYPLDQYALFSNNKKPIGQIADELMEAFRQAVQHAVCMPELTAKEAKKHLYCSLVSQKGNEELLERIPHEKIMDLAIIPKWLIDRDTTFIVDKNLLSHLKLTSNEVMEYARNNTEQMDVRIDGLTAVIREKMFDAEIAKEDIDELLDGYEEDEFLYVMTNHTGMEGAATMISRAALAQATDRIGESFYILPSSRHEVMLVPQSQSFDMAYMKNLVKEVNETAVAAADWLSDNVYHYDCETKTLSLCGREKEKAVEPFLDRKHHHTK